MITLQENINLKPYNTFGIEVFSKYFVTFNSIEALQEVLLEKKIKALDRLVLGGGSNILFTQNFSGIILKNEMEGITIEKETETEVLVKVGAGVNWHQFVLYSIHNNWYGLENLSLIPGNVGAAPMQNIGAYGVETKDFISTVETYHILDDSIKVYNNAECKFGYRESIFKKELKGQCIITAVTFKLSKKANFNTSYGAIEAELAKMNITDLTLKAISDAVIRIRTSKLPDPKIIGNAGSFFKNPSIDYMIFEKLKTSFPNIVGYINTNKDTVKIAAGWLIEQCGLKGVQVGQTGCHITQALVLVNYGKATGKEILEYSTKVIETVQNKFGITLEREVNVV